MSNTRTAALAYAHQNHGRFLSELKDFLSIPSVSTKSEHRADMRRAAEWVAGQLRELGMTRVEFFPPETHPLVYAEWLGAGADAPTVLVYGHYDVQPAEPLDKWHSDPFTPTLKGDNLFARGATDMKGQVQASLKAVEAIVRTGEMPVNLKFLIEGEEEIGSITLDSFIEENKELLAADFCLNPDTGMLAPDLPTITYALRGMAYFELRVYGPAQDLHSGVFGGAVHNPGQVMAELIAKMHNSQGRVTLPGFYDSVRALDAEERAELARLPISEDFFLKTAGAPQLWEGEQGYTVIERVGARPTLEVNGLYTGFIGEGAKTVLPAYAMAKISCRLVPDQEAREVEAQMRTFLEQNAPPTVRWELDFLSGGLSSISDRHSPAIQAMSAAMESVWGKRPVFKREGGSVPVVGQFQKSLGIESVNTGFALPEDNMHGPDEKLHLPTWQKGVQALIHFMFNLAE